MKLEKLLGMLLGFLLAITIATGCSKANEEPANPDGSRTFSDGTTTENQHHCNFTNDADDITSKDFFILDFYEGEPTCGGIEKYYTQYGTGNSDGKIHFSNAMYCIDDDAQPTPLYCVHDGAYPYPVSGAGHSLRFKILDKGKFWYFEPCRDHGMHIIDSGMEYPESYCYVAKQISSEIKNGSPEIIVGHKEKVNAERLSRNSFELNFPKNNTGKTILWTIEFVDKNCYEHPEVKLNYFAHTQMCFTFVQPSINGTDMTMDDAKTLGMTSCLCQYYSALPNAESLGLKLHDMDTKHNDGNCPICSANVGSVSVEF